MQLHQLGRNAQLSARGATRSGRVSRAARTVVRADAGSKPTVLVSEKLGAAGIDMLKKTANVDASYGLSPEELKAKVALSDALIVRSATKVTREVFEASKGRLKVVGRAGVGIDNVDLVAATECGCLVVNAPTANTIAAAEHGIALLCAMARNVAQADASMKMGKWDRNTYVGTSLTGKTVAIIGFGKVGSEVARRAKGLGCKVIAYDPFASAEMAKAIGVTLMPLDDCLAQGDFFSLHMPLLPTTKNLFNDEVFAKIKKGARIINVARGGVIDEAALARALDAGQVSQAALDVWADEPPKWEGHPLVNRPDVVCTPHLGASTTEAQEDVAIEIVDAVVDALMGKLSANAVNAPMVPAEVLKELQPFIALAEGLGKAAVSLTGEGAFTDMSVIYQTPRGDDLDTRLLRANVLKGVLEGTTTAMVNLVNADLLAKKRGINVAEVTESGTGNDVLSGMGIKIQTTNTKFSGALDKGAISLQGSVRNGIPFLTRIGSFDVEVALEGSLLLIRQIDQPGLVAAVATKLANEKINISFMSVGRTGAGQEAIMACGIDSPPSAATVSEISKLNGIQEALMFIETQN
ncbi:D-isomer specific 2-hydroxyacid dehydrogenase [Dunaliella salina]|uniref:D-3-phosphoglycerate dehydrogenase n=1 Tax=Dunaliella salina TaxID=3046 RepID=A0ABQ7H5I6_DUNSA|nr:D-isomer specific 2-hydroxyacid dehydrogenase [Dunaliella salina]|eukprot:KAF5842120.1 D-isomer specific 2-hydroxyacid dehydrogenase [Dunaliella salina]